MSANFYNESGVMLGLDIHRFWTAAMVPVPTWPYVAVARFAGPSCDTGKLTPSVTSSAKPMCQEGFDLKAVAHIFVPLALPDPFLEGCELVHIVAASSSKAVLAVASVSGQGKPLAVCIEGGFGLNVNCHEGWKLPTGVVIQPNTVMTQPTAGDFASAFVDLALDNVIGKVSGPIAGKIAEKMGLKALKNVLKELIKDRLKELKKDHDKTIKKVVRDLV